MIIILLSQLPNSSDEDDEQMSQESVTMSSCDLTVLKLWQLLAPAKPNSTYQYDLDLKVQFMVLCEVIPDQNGIRKNISLRV